MGLSSTTHAQRTKLDVEFLPCAKSIMFGLGVLRLRDLFEAYYNSGSLLLRIHFSSICRGHERLQQPKNSDSDDEDQTDEQHQEEEKKKVRTAFSLFDFPR